jgi:hypothetical protein
VKTALLSGVMSQPFARRFGYRNLLYQFNRADGVWRPNAPRNSKRFTIADFIHAQRVVKDAHAQRTRATAVCKVQMALAGTNPNW